MEDIRSKIEQAINNELYIKYANFSNCREFNNGVERAVEKILNILGICGSCGQKIFGKGN